MSTRKATKKTKADSRENALRLSDERFRCHLELSPEWYWEQDENYRFTLISGGGFDKTGIDPRKHLGTTRWDGGAAPVGDDGNWAPHKAVLSARRPFADFVYKGVDARGETRYISVSGQPVFEAKKRFKGYRGIAKDITASVRAEQLLRLEHAVARCLSEADSASEALKAAIRAICETQSWECGRYFAVDEAAGVLRCTEGWSVPDPKIESFIESSRALVLRPGEGLGGHVWESAQPLWVPDITNDARAMRRAMQIGVRGTFVFPTTSEGKVVGVLAFNSREVREPDNRLLQAVRVIGGQIGQFVQRKRAEERVQHMATHDALTGLPNRAMFSQLVNHEIQVAQRYRRGFAVMFIDLDRFKAVNDTLGHDAGDKLLQEISARLKARLRASDVVSRIGGDEFVALLQELSDTEQVAVVARKLLSAAAEPLDIMGQKCQVSASIGICMYPDDAQDEQSLMKNADTAMYLAKERGRDTFQFFSRDIQAGSPERLAEEPTRVLLVEDSEADAEIVLRELRRGGFECRTQRVQTEADFRRALDEFRPDIVLSDFSMPQFHGMAALAISREFHAEIPFIFVSGTIGEAAAVETMKAGADDYVMKDNPARLLPAVKRELREAQVRRARRVAERALRESETRYRDLIGQASDGIFVTDREGNFLLVNPRYCGMLGYSEDELLRLNAADTYSEGERQHLLERFAQLGEAQSRLFERTMRRKDGSCFPVEISIRFLANGTHQGIARDISDRVRMEGALRDREAGLRRAQLVAKLAHVITGPDGSFESWSETLPQLIGVQPEGMPQSTRAWLDIVHPEDRSRFREKSIEAAVKGARVDVDYRLRRADGTWIHVGQVIEPLQGQARADRMRWFSTLQDVTDQIRVEEKVKRLNRVHAVLSGINALIVRVRDREELYREACRVAVEAGEFRMAWLGVVDKEAMLIKPVAWYGTGEDYIQLMPFGLDGRMPKARGLAGQAVRERKAMIVDDMTKDPRVLLQKQALERGFHSLVILPLLVSDEAVGVLALYAGEIGFFDDEEMKLLSELAGDVSFALDHIEKSEKLDYLAYYDSLTGLANRNLFHERLVQSVRAASRDQGKLALVLIDIERFKTINDSLGRQGGDELLKQVAERLARIMEDTTRLARISADHFAVVVRSVTGEDDVARLHERMMRECFGRPFRIASDEFRISARAGIAIYPGDGADADALFRNAEAALKKAKAGGERYLFYTQKMTERVAEKLALEGKLRLAIEREEFVLHYQPKVDLDARKIAGVEALIRWQSPELGLVPPMEFIPLLEETGLILEAGAWALRRAVLDHRRWKERGVLVPRVAVNVSPIQLRKRDFVATLEEALKLGPVPPGIDLEITESLVMENIQESMQKLETVRTLGVNVAVDDFGTGYSSLGYLARLPVQTLKIDRSFIITMLDDPAVMTLVSTIISLAHSLRLNVVAEGVDSEDQASALKRLGCDQMQGYIFSKPLPFEGITALLGIGS